MIAFSMKVSDFQAWCVICAVKFRSPHLDLPETEATNVFVGEEGGSLRAKMRPRRRLSNSPTDPVWPLLLIAPGSQSLSWEHQDIAYYNTVLQGSPIIQLSSRSVYSKPTSYWLISLSVILGGTPILFPLFSLYLALDHNAHPPKPRVWTANCLPALPAV